jgi:hypothetical protein
VRCWCGTRAARAGRRSWKSTRRWSTNSAPTTPPSDTTGRTRPGWRSFFPAGFRRVAFANAQRLDRDALRGRLLSSYTPGAEDPRREPMLRALDRLFDRFNASGHITIDYDTEVYFGTLR